MQSLVKWVVTAEQAGKRLDQFLAAHAASRAQARRQIDGGAVLVDGQPAKADQRLKNGQSVLWTPQAPPPSELLPEDIFVHVYYEDAAVIVLEKPAGLVVHPAAGHATGTLVHALLGRARGGDNKLRPGIIHRLDKGTSGVMVVAKSEVAHAHLGEQFRAHTIERRYQAIVIGKPPQQGKLDTLYGRHPSQRKKFSSKVRTGKRARTAFRVLERFVDWGAALVEARLETGRTHQVRVHCADAGFPVLGDPTYARPPRDEKLRAVAQKLGRPALHAAYLAFSHPDTGERQAFESPLPQDMVDVLTLLRC